MRFRKSIDRYDQQADRIEEREKARIDLIVLREGSKQIILRMN